MSEINAVNSVMTSSTNFDEKISKFAQHDLDDENVIKMFDFNKDGKLDVAERAAVRAYDDNYAKIPFDIDGNGQMNKAEMAAYNAYQKVIDEETKDKEENLKDFYFDVEKNKAQTETAQIKTPEDSKEIQNKAIETKSKSIQDVTNKETKNDTKETNNIDRNDEAIEDGPLIEEAMKNLEDKDKRTESATKTSKGVAYPFALAGNFAAQVTDVGAFAAEIPGEYGLSQAKAALEKNSVEEVRDNGDQAKKAGSDLLKAVESPFETLDGALNLVGGIADIESDTLNTVDSRRGDGGFWKNAGSVTEGMLFAPMRELLTHLPVTNEDITSASIGCVEVAVPKVLGHRYGQY